MRYDRRATPLPNSPRKIDLFSVNTQLKQDPKNVIENFCNVKTNANLTKGRGRVYTGSRGHTYSESDEGLLRRLFCKSKSFKITNTNGKLRKIAAEGTATLSNDTNYRTSLYPKRMSKSTIGLGTRGSTSMGSNASKKTASMAAETKV